jgi:hypothetical protein
MADTKEQHERSAVPDGADSPGHRGDTPLPGDTDPMTLPADATPLVKPPDMIGMMAEAAHADAGFARVLATVAHRAAASAAVARNPPLNDPSRHRGPAKGAVVAPLHRANAAPDENAPPPAMALDAASTRPFGAVSRKAAAKTLVGPGPLASPAIGAADDSTDDSDNADARDFAAPPEGHARIDSVVVPEEAPPDEVALPRSAHAATPAAEPPTGVLPTAAALAMLDGDDASPQSADASAAETLLRPASKRMKGTDLLAVPNEALTWRREPDPSDLSDAARIAKAGDPVQPEPQPMDAAGSDEPAPSAAPEAPVSAGSEGPPSAWAAEGRARAVQLDEHVDPLSLPSAVLAAQRASESAAPPAVEATIPTDGFFSARRVMMMAVVGVGLALLLWVATRRDQGDDSRAIAPALPSLEAAPPDGVEPAPRPGPTSERPSPAAVPSTLGSGPNAPDPTAPPPSSRSADPQPARPSPQAPSPTPGPAPEPAPEPRPQPSTSGFKPVYPLPPRKP